jgi:hypothetical protein
MYSCGFGRKEFQFKILQSFCETTFEANLAQLQAFESLPAEADPI